MKLNLKINPKFFIILLGYSFILSLPFILSLSVNAEECKGNITKLDWMVDRDDKITISVEFQNTGEKRCKYVVYFYDENGEQKAHRPRFGKTLNPWETWSVGVERYPVERFGSKFSVRLKHANELMDSREDIEIAFTCDGTCHGNTLSTKSYLSEEDCWYLLGSECGKDANCEGIIKFDECFDCCSGYCSATDSIPEEFKEYFEDGCIQECGKKCNTYYEILTVENPNSGNIKVKDPCGYAKTLVVYDANCKQISGDFEDYKISDIPQCRAFTLSGMDYELLFPEKKLSLGSISLIGNSTGKCEITNAWWDRTTATREEPVRMLIELSEECKDRDLNIVYTVYLHHIWWFDTEIIKTTENIWIPEREGTYYFRADLFENGRRISKKSSNQIKISDCVDDALLLCQARVGKKVIYGVSNATKYREITSLNLSGGKTKHWILDKTNYTGMDIKKCYDPEKGLDYEKHIIAHDTTYREFVNENFGEEPLFKKFEKIYGKNYTYYLYCYKTDLKDTRKCRKEDEYRWYSLQNNFSILFNELINPTQIEAVKKWNFYQDVDEIPPRDAFSSEQISNSKLIKNAWIKIFTITPKLEDRRNLWNWTTVGNGTVYIGAGFESEDTWKDACKFSCDSKGENDSLEGCNSREYASQFCGGSGIDDCSTCYENHCEANNEDCTKSGKDPSCGGDGINDCGKICKIEAHYSDTGIIAETKFIIPNVEINNDATPEVKEIAGNIKEITHPAFLVIERGNLNFDIENLEFIHLPEQNTYILRRTYKPENKRERFIIDSDIVLNYTLIEDANSLSIDVENTYEIEFEKDIYTVACEHSCCNPCDDACCGYEHNVIGCNFDHTETESDTQKVKDSIKIYNISHSNMTSNTNISITGLIDKFVNEFNEIKISGSINVTLNPDILGGFILSAKDAGVGYRDIFYPVRHYLTKKRSSPPENGVAFKEYGYETDYGYQDKEFNFPEQCKVICPSDPECICPIDNPLEPMCINYSTEEGTRYKREDCVCIGSDCYPNPCFSNRTYHEEESSRIVNGNFESELEPFWKIKSGTASRELGGHSGYMLKLNGEIYQEFYLPTHSQPYGEICLEFKASENSKNFEIIITEDNGYEETKTLCSEGSCSNGVGWTKKCFPVHGNLSKITLKSDNEIFIDNINLGKFYDFVDIQTYNISGIVFMDRKLKGWESVGLFKTSGVEHKDNSYIFDLIVLSQTFLHPTTGEFLIYTLTDKDILNTTIELYTFFRNKTIPLFPARREKNLYVNITFRNASKIGMEYYPRRYSIPFGKRVTVKLNLTFFETNESIPNEKIYITLIGDDIWKSEPENLMSEVVNGIKRAYVVTNEMGTTNFSFIPVHTVSVNAEFLGNERASPSKATITIPVHSFKSPLLSIELLVLVIIFYLAVFSYRFFQPKRTDIYHWWEEFKGRRL